MLNIRDAKQDDITFISMICLETDELYSNIMPNSFIRQSEKYQKSGLPSDYQLYIISSEDDDIGFLGIKKVTVTAVYLVALYLKKKLYRKSYGTNSLHILSDQLKLNHIQTIYLQAHKDAVWAIKFYEKCGFTIVSDLKVPNIDIMDHAIAMKKEL